MATAAALISVEEYLATKYEPECEYLDGELVEKDLGQYEHSSTQSETVGYLLVHYPRLHGRILTEQHIRVKPKRFRIPDICILAEGGQPEKILTTPPRLCIEILSEDDEWGDYMDRFDDYFAMGVPVCWIIDPLRRKGWVATTGHIDESLDGVLRTGEFELPLAEIFKYVPTIRDEPVSNGLA